MNCCSIWPTIWRASPRREAEHRAGEPAGGAHRRNPVAALVADRRRKERLCVRLLDRKARRAAAQAEPAGGHREGRGRSREAEDVRGLLAPFLRDTLVALQLRALRAAGRADALYQSAVRPRPRFPRHAGRQSHLARDRSCSAPAGRRTAAGGWWVRWPACPTRWPRPSRTSWSPRRRRR